MWDCVIMFSPLLPSGLGIKRNGIGRGRPMLFVNPINLTAFLTRRHIFSEPGKVHFCFIIRSRMSKEVALKCLKKPMLDIPSIAENEQKSMSRLLQGWYFRKSNVYIYIFTKIGSYNYKNHSFSCCIFFPELESDLTFA